MCMKASLNERMHPVVLPLSTSRTLIEAPSGTSQEWWCNELKKYWRPEIPLSLPVSTYNMNFKILKWSHSRDFQKTWPLTRGQSWHDMFTVCWQSHHTCKANNIKLFVSFQQINHESCWPWRPWCKATFYGLWTWPHKVLLVFKTF